jgi:hypothetical protein
LLKVSKTIGNSTREPTIIFAGNATISEWLAEPPQATELNGSKSSEKRSKRKSVTFASDVPPDLELINPPGPM